MDLYRQKILDHYKRPRNFGRLSDPSKSQLEENPSCGDSIIMDIILENNKVKNIKFSGEGCAISIASASMLTEKVKGMQINEIAKLKTIDIEEMLGLTLSPSRIKCAMLSLNTLKKILIDELKKT